MFHSGSAARSKIRNPEGNAPRMNVWIAAWRDLQERPHLVYGYMGAVLLAILPVQFLSDWLAPDIGSNAVPPWWPLFTLACDVYVALTLAAVQAVGYCLLGRAIDRPLWRCPSVQDALRRFYVPWLLVQLCGLVLLRAQVFAARADLGDVAVLMEIFLVVYEMVVPLVIICAMHWGRFEWHELGEAVRPILRFPLLTMQAAALPFIAHVFWLMIMFSLDASEHRSSLLLIGLRLPIAFLDILAFAAMWRVCMHARNAAAHGDEDDPFDF